MLNEVFRFCALARAQETTCEPVYDFVGCRCGGSVGLLRGSLEPHDGSCGARARTHHQRCLEQQRHQQSGEDRDGFQQERACQAAWPRDQDPSFPRAASGGGRPGASLSGRPGRARSGSPGQGNPLFLNSTASARGAAFQHHWSHRGRMCLGPSACTAKLKPDPQRVRARE